MRLGRWDGTYLDLAIYKRFTNWNRLAHEVGLPVLQELVDYGSQGHRLNGLVQQVQATRARLAQTLRRSVAAHHEGWDRPVGLAKFCYCADAGLPPSLR